MRIAEFFQVLPGLLFAMALVSLFGPGPVTVAMAIGASGGRRRRGRMASNL